MRGWERIVCFVWISIHVSSFFSSVITSVNNVEKDETMFELYEEKLCKAFMIVTLKLKLTKKKVKKRQSKMKRIYVQQIGVKKKKKIENWIFISVYTEQFFTINKSLLFTD